MFLVITRERQIPLCPLSPASFPNNFYSEKFKKVYSYASYFKILKLGMIEIKSLG